MTSGSYSGLPIRGFSSSSMMMSSSGVVVVLLVGSGVCEWHTSRGRAVRRSSRVASSLVGTGIKWLTAGEVCPWARKVG